MSKYEPLATFLEHQAGDEVRVTFAQLEKVLGFELPPSKRFAAWWSNNPTNSVMTKVWLKAGWRTRSVNVDGEKVSFVRTKASDSFQNPENDLSKVIEFDDLSPVAQSVLAVLAKRSGRSIGREAVQILNEALDPKFVR